MASDVFVLTFCAGGGVNAFAPCCAPSRRCLCVPRFGGVVSLVTQSLPSFDNETWYQGSALCGEKIFVGLPGDAVRTQQFRDFASGNRPAEQIALHFRAAGLAQQ